MDSSDGSFLGLVFRLLGRSPRSVKCAIMSPKVFRHMNKSCHLCGGAKVIRKGFHSKDGVQKLYCKSCCIYFRQKYKNNGSSITAREMALNLLSNGLSIRKTASAVGVAPATVMKLKKCKAGRHTSILQLGKIGESSKRKQFPGGLNEKEKTKELEIFFFYGYSVLLILAKSYLNREGDSAPMQPEELVNECFLSLASQRKQIWNDKSHFIGIASRLMRQFLVGRVRKRNAKKRSARVVRRGENTLDNLAADSPSPDQLMLYEGLSELKNADPRKNQIVVLRYFGGLSNDEIAESLHTSVSSVKREMVLAKNWLFEYMSQR